MKTRKHTLWALGLGLIFTACKDAPKAESETKDEEENITAPVSYNLSISLSNADSANYTNAPELQSFAHAVSGEQWLLMCGRTNSASDGYDGGLHNMGPSSNYSSKSFPPVSFNTSIYLYDASNNSLSSLAFADFNAALTKSAGSNPDATLTTYFNDVVNHLNQLRCSNPLATQVGDNLYIVGGYGTNPDSTQYGASYQTFNTVTQIHVPTMIKVINGQSVTATEWESFYRMGSADQLQSTGGELHAIDGTFYLCGGHNYGKGALKGQKYVDAVYPFTVSNASGNMASLDITVSDAISDMPADKIKTHEADLESIFRRRDGPMVPILAKNSAGAIVQGVAFYAGVFKPTPQGQKGLEAWNDAIYVTPDLAQTGTTVASYKMDTDYNQQNYNVYSCPDFGAVHSNESGDVLLSTFMPGGIGNGDAEGKLSPFSNTYVEAVLNTSSMTSTPNIVKESMYPDHTNFLGAEAAFMPANDASIKYYSSSIGTTEFVDVAATFGPTGGSKVIGYFYGGIEAEIASPGSGDRTGYGAGLSKATNQVWAVTLTATPYAYEDK